MRSRPCRGPPRFGESPPRHGESPPRLGAGPPQLGEGPPQLGEGPPQLGEGPPRLGEGPPQLGEGPPRLGESPPRLGEGPPQLGESPPRLGEGPPRFGDGPPQLGESPPRLDGSPPRLDGGPSQRDAGRVEPDSLPRHRGSCRVEPDSLPSQRAVGRVESDSLPAQRDVGRVEPDSLPAQRDTGRVEPDSLPAQRDTGRVEPDSLPAQRDASRVEPDSLSRHRGSRRVESDSLPRHRGSCRVEPDSLPARRETCPSPSRLGSGLPPDRKACPYTYSVSVDTVHSEAVPPRWDKDADYAYLEGITLHGWAWEFLRRNPHYRADFTRGSDPSPWGLFRPCDPDRSYREVFPFWMASALPVLLNPTLHAVLAASPEPGIPLCTPSRVSYMFDLTYPLEFQIEEAVKTLKILQGAGKHLARKRVSKIRDDHYKRYVRLLDGYAAGVSQIAMAAVLYGDKGVPRDSARRALREAQRLSRGGYQDLLLHPNRQTGELRGK